MKHSSYRREDEGNSRHWQRGEMFSKRKSIIYGTAKPSDVDSLLDHGMIVRAIKHPIGTRLLCDGQ